MAERLKLWKSFRKRGRSDTGRGGTVRVKIVSRTGTNVKAEVEK